MSSMVEHELKPTDVKLTVFHQYWYLIFLLALHSNADAVKYLRAGHCFYDDRNYLQSAVWQITNFGVTNATIALSIFETPYTNFTSCYSE